MEMINLTFNLSLFLYDAHCPIPISFAQINPTLWVESAPVAQCTMLIVQSQSHLLDARSSKSFLRKRIKPDLSKSFL